MAVNVRTLVPPREGEYLSARMVGDIIDALRQHDTQLAGMVGLISQGGVRQIFVPAVITRVYPADAHLVPYPASVVKYDAQCIDEPTKVVNESPFFGYRPVDNIEHKIIGAAVHHLAFIIRIPDAEGLPTKQFWAWSEKRATRVCGAGGA